MARLFFDSDADLTCLANRSVGILGYGNQGQAQALNLRDSGVRVIIGNQEDAFAQQASCHGREAGQEGGHSLLSQDEHGGHIGAQAGEGCEPDDRQLQDRFQQFHRRL